MNLRNSLLCMIVLTLAACTAPQAPQNKMSDMKMMPADRLSDSEHLILTVPLGQRPALMAQANRIEERYGVSTVAEWPLNSIGAHCLVLSVPGDASAERLAAEMQGDASIRTAQSVRNFRTLGTSGYADNLAPLQHGLKQIRASEAHETVTGKNIRIAVVDTGIDFSHPDLASRKAASMDLVGPDNTIDAPPEIHGTAVAGVIAADAEDDKGIIGVAPDAKIIGLRACWQEQSAGAGRCNSFSLARAINVAITKNADIINMSLGGPYDPLLAELVEKAHERGVTIIAAKEEEQDAYFPASMPGVVAVRSSSGSDGSLVAPGTDIISTAPDEGYDYFSGASVSAAHASGVAALLLERVPNLGPRDLNRALASGAPKPRALDACSAISSVNSDSGSACN